MHHEKILIIDNDARRRALHVFGLACAGFDACEATPAGFADRGFAEGPPDLVLLFTDRLDNEFQVLSRLLSTRSRPPGPRIVALLKKVTPADKALALELGYRDCLALPLAPQALVGKVHNWLNLQNSTRVPERGLEVDVDTGVLSRGGTALKLGPTERRTLAALLEYPECILTRDHLFRRVHAGKDANLGRLVDVSICRLRSSLKQLGCADLLQTVRGRGYLFNLRLPPVQEVARSSRRSPSFRC